MLVVLRVQHHPSRAGLLHRLVSGVGNLEVEVVEDPDPDGPAQTWPTYQRCLADTMADHIVVLQDDVVVCRGFAEQLAEAICEKPDEVFSLYTGAYPELTAIRARQAYQRGERWSLHQGSWIPAVALVWPAQVAEDARSWCSEARPQWSTLYPDDARLGHWARERQIRVWHRLPSLVDHPGLAPSLVGTKAGSHHHTIVPGDRRVRFP